MTGYAPVGGSPVGAPFPATRSVAARGVVRVRDLPAAQAVWSVEISAPGNGGVSRRAPAGLVSGLPTGAMVLPRTPASALGAVFASDLGWIGEPDDPDAPHRVWPPRLIEPPALEMGLTLYPGDGRRADVAAAELLLANGDGALDSLVGDWRLAGRKVIVRRGPHLRPRHARAVEMGRVAEMRVRLALDGDSQLRLVLTSAAADLSLAACNTYAGTGGAEGPPELAGQYKPRLYGIRRNIAPVQVDPGREIYQLHDGRMAEVLALRNRAVPQVFAGDVPTYAALAAATVPEGGYITCLATGHGRLGSRASLVTAAARGDSASSDLGYAGGTPASIAVKLLRGGGVDRTLATPEAFTAWPTAEAGLYLTGGSVAEAMEQLAAGIFAGWGADAFGGFRGTVLTVPEIDAAGLAIEPWMLAAPPAEVTLDQPPWWRVRTSYQTLDRVMSGEDIAQLVSAADRATLSQGGRIAPEASDTATQQLPAARDGPLLPTLFDAEAPAAALAQQMLGLFGRGRRSWQLSLRAGAGGIAPQMVMPGTVLTLTWPGIAALRQPKPLLVRDLSARGDSLTLTVWG